MPSLGNLWYALGVKDNTDADLDKIERKLQQRLSNVGVSIDPSKIRQSIEAALAAPFNASVSLNSLRADLDSIFLNKTYGVNAEVIASKLHDSIKTALAAYSGDGINVLPKKKELRKAVSDALVSAGFEIKIDKVKGLTATLDTALGTAHTLNVSVDPNKLAKSIERAAKSYSGKDISVEVKGKALKDSIRAALSAERFPIRVIVDKAEAQDAVRQALQAAGLQSSGFTASDKRAWDAQSRRMEAQARAAAATALAQRRLAGAHTAAARATDSHIQSSISLGSAMRGNIRIAGELGPMLASAYSVVALKNFMQKVVEIGGELEQQKLAMKAILGDEGMANTISQQINTLAVKSPFGVMELNQYAKQLTAFQIPYNELFDTMKRMADISAATGTDMGRIILAFGQIRSATVLKGTEARQLTEANIPIFQMLSDYYNKLEGQMVSVGDVMDRMSKKEIPFQDVKNVLWELTDAGGKFYNMQEELSESVKAKWKNFADAVDLMFADMANSLDGPLKSLAEVLTELTQHWATLAWAVASASAAFGAGKAINAIFARSLDATGKSALSAAAHTALLERRNLNLAKVYRTLTAEEQNTLSTRMTYWWSQKRMLDSLTNSQFGHLVATRQITKAEWERMIALGRLDTVQKSILVNNGILTKDEINNIRVLGRWRGAFLGVGNALRSVGRAMATLVTNPMTLAMAAIAGITALWQRNSEEAEKAEQAGKDAMTAYAESAKNLEATLKSLPQYYDGMKEVDLQSGIEKATQVIKDYSATAERDLLDCLINQQGEAASLAEQYQNLIDKLRQLQEASKQGVDSGFGKILNDSINDADKGFFSWFRENLLTDKDDYVNAFADLKSDMAEFAKTLGKTADLSKFVEKAKEVDDTFRAVAENLRTDEQRFMELLLNKDMYGGTIEQAGEVLDHRTRMMVEYYRDAADGQFDELVSEFGKVMQKQLVNAAAEGITPDNATGEVKRNLVAWFIKTTDGLPEIAKRRLQGIFEDIWKVDVDDGRAHQAVIDAFGKKFESLAPLMAKKIKSGAQFADFSFMDRSSAERMVTIAANEVMAQMPQFRAQIQKYLDDNEFEAKVVMQWGRQNKDGELKKMLWSSDAENLMAVGPENVFDQMSAGAKSTRDIQDNYIKEGKDIKERIKAAKANNAAAMELERLNTEWNLHAESYRRAHFGDLEEAIKKDGKRDGGSQPDALAEELKAKFKDLKDAWAMYKNWQKSVGDDAAFDTVANSGLFKYIDLDEIPRSVEAYDEAIRALQKQLEDAGVKGIPARESLLNEMIKTLYDVRKPVVDEQLKLALDKVTKEAEKQLADWNLFDKIRRATGNQQLAMNIAFGMGVGGETDYVKMVKKQFEAVAKAEKSTLTFDTATPNSLDKAPKEVKKAWEKAYGLIQKYRDKEREDVAEMVEQYQSTQEEIIAMTAEAEDKKRKIRKSKDLTPIEKEQITAKIDADLNYEIFRKSGEYLNFFNAILSMTGDEAEKVGQKIKDALDDKLKSGAISAKDYCEEMERIEKQLDKIRQKQKGFGGLGSFVKGGLQQMFKDQFDQAQDDFNAATQNYDKAKQQFDLFSKEGNEAGKKQAQSAMGSASAMKKGASAAMQGARGALSTVAIIDTIVHGINDTVQGIKGSFDLIAEMADSFGVDTSADTGWGTAGAVLEAFSEASQHATDAWDSLKSGNVGGVIKGVVGSVTSWFTVFNRWHDAKLQKQIERSKEAAQIMQNQYDILEKQMANFLGNAANMNTGVLGGGYGKQRELMQGQLAELEKQRQAEIDKKKTDNSVVEDYNKQIEEMKISIRDFAIEAANAIYGIDLNGWAEQLGDALTDAFAKGEDAAEAFDKKVGDIMRDVASKMISQDILAPMFGDLRNYLFGENGMSGAFGADFQLSPDEAAKMKEYMDRIKNQGIPAAQELYDAINEATGGILDDTSAKSGLSAGIQSVTEDTADLLASYLNSIRADVSLQVREYLPKLLEAMPLMNTIAQSQLDTQRQIAENTLRNAVAAEEIARSNDDISRLLNRVTQGVAKFNIQ